MDSSPRAEPPGDSDICPFCDIAGCFLPFNPAQPPTSSHPSLSSTQTASAETFIVLSTPMVVAFLDTAPLAEGHILLCPREHREKLTAVSSREASELGRWLRVVSAGLMRVLGLEDFNVVQNNGAAAAQVVPHAHFHIIPRPDIRRQGRWSEQFTMFGRGQRTDLDEQEAAPLAEKIRNGIAQILQEEARGEGVKL